MKMKKRILIIYASYGSGHKTVATYIYNYIKAKKDYEAYLMNIMDYSNKIGKISEKLFDLNIKYSCSFLFTCLYKTFDHKVTTIPYEKVVKSLFIENKLKSALNDIKPDLIIATHFFGATIGSLYTRKIISVITDYKSHELWEKDKISYYIVANKMIKKELITKGISKKQIYSFGIPISEEFNTIDQLQINKIKKEYQVDNGKKTILFFAGGSLGSSSVFRYLKKIIINSYDCNILFVCGKNLDLKKKCTSYIKENNIKNVNVIGFSNEVNKLLNISDFVITKPGGISITECLQLKKPLILIKGNGGQEIYNAKYVCSNKYGVYAKNEKILCEYVNIFLKNKHKKIQENIAKYNQNNSIKKIYKIINKVI